MTLAQLVQRLKMVSNPWVCGFITHVFEKINELLAALSESNDFNQYQVGGATMNDD